MSEPVAWYCMLKSICLKLCGLNDWNPNCFLDIHERRYFLVQEHSQTTGVWGGGYENHCA